MLWRSCRLLTLLALMKSHLIALRSRLLSSDWLCVDQHDFRVYDIGLKGWQVILSRQQGRWLIGLVCFESRVEERICDAPSFDNNGAL